MQKLLTLGIPTFNGAPHIEEALDSILRQFSDGISEHVEILVSDNGSTDNTGRLLEKYVDSFPDWVRYSRNMANLGFDQNVDILFKKANGRYVWLLGDDDALYEGALSHVVNLIQTHQELVAIQVNFDKFDSKLASVVERIPIEKDVYCDDGNMFLQNARGRWGAIASLVIKTDEWNKVDLKHAFDSKIIFAYGLFSVVRNGFSLICGRALVKVREGSEKRQSGLATATPESTSHWHLARSIAHWQKWGTVATYCGPFFGATAGMHTRHYPWQKSGASRTSLPLHGNIF